jgi:hypothetical protein
MTTRSRYGSWKPATSCTPSRATPRGLPLCQTVHGTVLDNAVGELVVGAVTPLALEAALSVQQELNDRLDEADRLRQRQVERDRYDADLAQRRFLRVDPENRLVANELEADWK